MTFKGSFIKIIVLSFFVLAITTVINGKPGVTEETTTIIGCSKNVNVTPPAFVEMERVGEEMEYVEVTVELDEGTEVNQGTDLTKRTLVFNGVGNPEGVIGNTDMDIIWYRLDELYVNGTAFPVINGNKGITIKYHEEGGITVNGQKIDGFETIKGRGKTHLKLKKMKTVGMLRYCVWYLFNSLIVINVLFSNPWKYSRKL
ncbi:uncharacterized protein LOC126845834 isoform X2 [Adelges cooleyi]|uniref:uncharacterized protein LOC126845834 isoform X2 n=1 Tax=Adelges cooleyi TaxID=133065 RepID=UPI00217F2B4E|nr:uncharacterized protein LOC126845834 isoform X2 [Adelges cooleyi]